MTLTLVSMIYLYKNDILLVETNYKYKQGGAKEQEVGLTIPPCHSGGHSIPNH